MLTTLLFKIAQKKSKQSISSSKNTSHELDELLHYIEKYENDILHAQGKLHKKLPYWVCKF